MIGCLLIPHLPLSALLEANPGDADRLIVVHRGRVADASRKARQAGVLPGMTTARAQTLLPRARPALREIGRERRYSERLASRLYRLTPCIETASLDRFFAADIVPDELRPFVDEHSLRAGFGATRNEALLVALRAAEGHLLAPDEHETSSFWSRYPASALALLFGEEIIERLDQLGFSTLASLRRLTLRHLRVQFGSEGERLYRLLHPVSSEPPVALYRPPESVTAALDLDDAIATREALMRAVQMLFSQATCRLGERRFRRITLEATTKDGVQAVPVLLREPSADGPYVWRVLSDLLPRVAPVPHDVTRLTLLLEELSAPEGTQSSLFKDRSLVLRAVRQVHQRYPGAMLTARVVEHALLPEERTRFEVMAA